MGRVKTSGASKQRQRANARQPQLRVLLGSAIGMGPGKAALLRAIDETGSITAAARHMGMSYRRAWLLVDTMNCCFRAPLVETATGGHHGGGARVTELGHDVLARYLEMEAKASASVAKDLAAFTRLMASR